MFGRFVCFNSYVKDGKTIYVLELSRNCRTGKVFFRNLKPEVVRYLQGIEFGTYIALDYDMIYRDSEAHNYLKGIYIMSDVDLSIVLTDVYIPKDA